VREVIEETIRRLSEKELNPSQLERIKKRLLGQKKIAGQTLTSQSQEAGLFQLYGLGFDYEETLNKEIADLRPTQIMEFARKYFDPEKKVTVILSPE